MVDVKVHQGQVVFQKAPSNSSLLPIFSYILTLMLVVLLSQTMDSRWLLYAQKASKIFYWRFFELLCSMLRFIYDSSFLKSGIQLKVRLSRNEFMKLSINPKQQLKNLKDFCPSPKLYTPSTPNIDLILWHTHWIVCAVKSITHDLIHDFHFTF